MAKSQLDPVKESSDYLLNRWARWIRTGNHLRELGYPGCSAEQKIPGASYPSETDNDELSEYIDEVLKTLSPERQEVSKMYYVKNIPMKKICETLGITYSCLNVFLIEIRGVAYGASISFEKKVLNYR